MFSIAPIHLATRVLPAAILLTATAVFVLFVVQDSADREPLMLTGVCMPDIERGFQHFLTPSNNDQPQITPSDAREGAERKIPSDWIQDPEVREITLALLVSDDGPSEDLVWIINYDPAAVTIHEPGSDYKVDDYALYLLSVVDAETGEVIFTEGGSGTCDDQPAHPEYAAVIREACG